MKKKILKFLSVSLIVFVISISAVALLTLAVNILIDNSAKDYCHYELQDIPEADAIMVLGASVFRNGQPSPVLRDRLDYGLILYNSGKAKKIIVSGDHGSNDYDEVNSMKNYLLDKGVPREDIFLDHAGFNTYDSMYRAREIFHISSLIISTQQFHISRSVYIARSMGIEAYGYPSQDKPIYNMRYLNAREALAKVKAFIDTSIKRTPKLLGEPIPIDGSGIVTEG